MATTGKKSPTRRKKSPTRAKKTAARPPVATAGSAEKQLSGFIGKFAPERAREIRAARKKMRALLPSATEMVYDNYNFFVIGYGPNDRASLAIFSIVAQAKSVGICFLQ